MWKIFFLLAIFYKKIGQKTWIENFEIYKTQSK